MMCNMEPDMKAQIVKVIDKILSDGQLIYSKVSMLQTDPIDGSKILEKLEKVKDVIEDLCQMELIDATADAKMPKIVSAFSLSPSNLSTTTSIAPTCDISGLENYLSEYNEFEEFDGIETLFDHLELDEFPDIRSTDSEYSDHESLQGFPCSIRDICDYDSDTGICEY